LFQDLDGARERYYTEYRLADFTVDLKRGPEWTVREVESLPNVREARGRVDIGVLIDLPNRDQLISGRAISLPETRTPVLDDVHLRSGTWFSGTDDKEAILNDSFAKANGLVAGDRIQVLLLDRQHDLLVVGTAMSPEFVYLLPVGGGIVPDPAMFGVLYANERFLQESCDLEGAFNQIVGMCHDTSPLALSNTLQLIEDHLDSFGVTNTTPVQDQPSVRFLADELKGLQTTAIILPSLFLVVSVLVLNVLIGKMVSQQRTVIGTLKALGYSGGELTRHYLSHGLIIGVLGGLTGGLFGYWMQVQLLDLYSQFYAMPGIRPHFYPDAFLGGLAIGIIAALLGTISGLRYAARLEPAEAMRPPPPERGGKVLPEYIPFFWNALSFRGKMILRAIFRNPFRSLTSALATAIATALVDYLMSYEFERVSRQDITVSLRDPEGQGTAQEISNMVGVSRSEPQLGVVCDLTHGPRAKRMGITGIPRGAELYTPLDSKGNPIVIPDAGLVLSKKLGEILNAKPGDILKVRSLIGQRKTTRAPVVGTVDTFLGLSAYADLQYLAELLGEERSANTVLATLHPGADQEEFLNELKKRPTVIGVGERRRSLDQLEATFGETMGIMIGIMVLFAGLIAFGGVLNTALVSLSDRQREVGTLRVLGYTPGQISAIFSGESLIVNALGIAAGLLLGVGLAHLVSWAYNTELYRFPVVLLPRRFVESALTLSVFVGLAQGVVYRMIRSLEWLDVLKVKE
jgi:putative ABC transport system permease protein